MSKALNQIELGTTCIIKETGQSATLQRIFHYPTKYLVENEEGEFQYYSTHEISFEGYDRPKTSLSIPDIPYEGIGTVLQDGFHLNQKVKWNIIFLVQKKLFGT